MKDRILFWCGRDFLYYGIAYFLNQQYDCELFSIFETEEKPKKFFKSQKLVPFKKTWFFNDYAITQNKEFDVKYLSSIEKKYGLNIWLIAYAERFFGVDERSYHKFTRNEILFLIEQECRFFERVLDEVKPDFLIMGITTLHHNHLFYKICKTRGIKILMIRPSFLAGKYIIADAIDTFENFSYEQKHNFSSLQQLRNYLKKYDSTNQARLVRNRFQTSKINYLKAIFQYLFSSNTNVKTHYTYYGRTKFAVIKEMFFYTVKKKLRGYFINKNL